MLAVAPKLFVETGKEGAYPCIVFTDPGCSRNRLTKKITDSESLKHPCGK